MQKGKKVLSTILVLLVLIGIGTFSFLYFGTYSEGVRSGIIMKVSKRGTLFKTYEGQLNMEGFGAVNAENEFSEVWEFSVEKSHTDVIEKLEQASLDGGRINLKYIERFTPFFWRGDTKYFVTEVEFKEGEQEPKKKKKLFNP